MAIQNQVKGTLPKVSIITPSYNQALFLEQAIQSVLEQDYSNIEYIIIDGGSTDGSVDIIRKYDSHLAYWVSEPDRGQYDAQNKGLRCMTGNIWAWMNADDAYLPGAISQAVEWLNQHSNHEIVYADCMNVDENGRYLRPIYTRDFNYAAMLTGSGMVPTGSTFFRRKVVDQIGEFDETLHYVGDIDYLFRAGEICKFGHVPEMWSLYRIHPDARTWDREQSAKRAVEFVRVYERFWSRSGLSPRIGYLKAQSLAKVYLYAAHLASRVDQRSLCLDYVIKSLGMGVPALRPRLLRLVIYLMLGKKVDDSIQKFRSTKAKE